MYQPDKVDVGYIPMTDREATPRPMEVPNAPSALQDVAKAAQLYAAASETFFLARRAWAEAREAYLNQVALATSIVEKENV